MEILETIQSAATRLTLEEILAVIFGLIYVILAAKENVWCWFWGILSCSFWAYVTYFQYALLADAILQIFYVVMGFVGWYQWKRGGQEKTKQKELSISKIPFRQHVIILFFGIVCSFLLGYFFDKYTPAAATYLDALTTIFAIVATFMTIRKILENWIYWIIIDLLYIYLYTIRGGYLFALLFIIYCVVAVIGYVNWRKAYILDTG